MTRTIHAIIIGINAYPSHPLYGCVNDALAVGRFFKEFCENKDSGLRWNPQYLLAPHPVDEASIEQGELSDSALAQRRSPLRANVIEAFNAWHSAEVKPDDICLFYYSGHGALELAAPEFAHLEPDGMNETFVCLDSRNEGQRDLLDKELAWLLSRAKKRLENGHLLVITDSCHSGGATRSSDVLTRDRRESSSDSATPFEEIVGVLNVPVQERIFELKGKKAFYSYEAPHIHLAAARDCETAKETHIEGQQHGIFTWNFLRVLGSGGTALSYRELMRRTEIMVRSMVSNQLPQLNALAGAQKVDSFLGGALASAVTEYPLVFENKQWQMKAGALNGIVLDPAGVESTLVRLTDGRKIKVKEVFSNYAILDQSGFTAEDEKQLLFQQRASIIQMPNSKISIFIEREAMPPSKLSDLMSAIDRANLNDCSFNANSAETADYTVRTDEKGQYMLLRKGSNYPVFKRQTNSFDFLRFCDGIGRWRFVQEMGKASMKDFSVDDLDISLELLQDIDQDSINTAKGELVSPDNISLTYMPPTETGREMVPALRCIVKSKKTGVWIGGLYLDNEFGIHPFLDVRQNRSGEEHVFTYTMKDPLSPAKGFSYNAIPLLIDPVRLQQGVREITEYLKIYVSNQDFSLADFEQEPLPLDDQPITRGIGFGRGFSSTPDWMVLTIPVNIKAASTPAALDSLSGAGFRVSEVPQEFSAKAALSSISEINEKLARSPLTRGAELELRKFVLPPDGLWGETMEEAVVFGTAFDAQQSQSVSVMELTEVQGKLTAPFFLELDTPCLEDEVIVAYGYDADAESYFPVGLSNGNNRVEVLAMPSETPGRIQGEEDGFVGRDLGGSVKMFFKKLVKKQNPNTLILVNKDMSRVTDLEKIREAVSNAKNILMVTHGFLGDTDKIASAMMQKTRVHESYDVLLTYDFENLNTPLEESAKDMYKRLQDAGVFDPLKGRRLTILGSSMGGLVCRWMIEKDRNGVEFIRKLFLVATPNLGTDISTFRKRLFALIGKALSGVAAIKPYLLPLSILGKKAEKDLWVTLNQMNPQNSAFLDDLNKNGVLPAEIKRSMIGGSVKGLGLNRNNKGNFMKRLKKFVMKTFMDWFVFEGEHDLINPLKSQKGAPWLKPEDMVILKVDHLSYYFEEESFRELEKALRVEAVGA